MKISITVKPNAKQEKVEPMPDGSYRVSVKAPPVEGKANEAVVAALAHYFSVPKSSVEITGGLRGKRKRVEILRGAKNS